jgi:hypothetical protein
MNDDLAKIFGGGFDGQGYEPQHDFDVLPPGKYECLIEKAGVKQTKKGDGSYLELTLQVIQDGAYKNRKLWDRINIENPSEECQRIGRSKLEALRQAVLPSETLKDTSQLVSRVCVASVKVKDNNNEIRTYSGCVNNPYTTSNVVNSPVKKESEPENKPQNTPPWKR